MKQVRLGGIQDLHFLRIILIKAIAHFGFVNAFATHSQKREFWHKTCVSGAWRKPRALVRIVRRKLKFPQGRSHMLAEVLRNIVERCHGGDHSVKGPKIHLSRKLVLIFGGVLVLCGGTGAAAVFIGADTLLGPSYAELNGLECTEVKTVEIHKKDRYWVRKYITTNEPGDGLTRVKTALRVARSVQTHEKADLVQVVVLDAKGPKDRAEMRGRAVGADVIFIPDPSRVPEEATAQVFTARYVDKAANDSGQYYGERIDMIAHDIDALVAKLNDETDCLKPEIVAPEGAGGHGAAPAAGHGEAPAGHGEASGGHGEAPAGGHGEAPAEDAHGAAPAEGHGDAPAEGHGEAAPVAEHGETKDKGWMASIMGMVGLGGSDELAADAHGATEAPAAAEAGGHDGAADGHEAPAEDEATAAAGDHAPDASDGHGAEAAHAPAVAPEEHGAPAEASVPAEEQGWFSSLKGMVGLGGEEAAADEKDSSEGADTAPSADEVAKKKWPKPAVNQIAPDGEPAQPKHDGADWLAKMRAKPIAPAADGGHAADAPDTGHDEAAPQHGNGAAAKPDEAHGAAAPAEDQALLPPKASAHGEEEAKAGH
jgi:hypothetical protein